MAADYKGEKHENNRSPSEHRWMSRIFSVYLCNQTPWGKPFLHSTVQIDCRQTSTPEPKGNAGKIGNEETCLKTGKITVFWDATPFSLVDVCRRRVGPESVKQANVSGQRVAFIFKVEQLVKQETRRKHNAPRTSHPLTEISLCGAIYKSVWWRFVSWHYLL
jgi:hypothetical protein